MFLGKTKIATCPKSQAENPHFIGSEPQRTISTEIQSMIAKAFESKLTNSQAFDLASTDSKYSEPTTTNLETSTSILLKNIEEKTSTTLATCASNSSGESSTKSIQDSGFKESQFSGGKSKDHVIEKPNLVNADKSLNNSQLESTNSDSELSKITEGITSEVMTIESSNPTTESVIETTDANPVSQDSFVFRKIMTTASVEKMRMTNDLNSISEVSTPFGTSGDDQSRKNQTYSGPSDKNLPQPVSSRDYPSNKLSNFTNYADQTRTLPNSHFVTPKEISSECKSPDSTRDIPYDHLESENQINQIRSKKYSAVSGLKKIWHEFVLRKPQELVKNMSIIGKTPTGQSTFINDDQLRLRSFERSPVPKKDALKRYDDPRLPKIVIQNQTDEEPLDLSINSSSFYEINNRNTKGFWKKFIQDEAGYLKVNEIFNSNQKYSSSESLNFYNEPSKSSVKYVKFEDPNFESISSVTVSNADFNDQPSRSPNRFRTTKYKNNGFQKRMKKIFKIGTKDEIKSIQSFSKKQKDLNKIPVEFQHQSTIASSKKNSTANFRSALKSPVDNSSRLNHEFISPDNSTRHLRVPCTELWCLLYFVYLFVGLIIYFI